MASLLLKNVRIAFPKLWEPEVFAAGGKPKYNATFLFEKTGDTAKTVLATIKEVLREKFGEKAAEYGRTMKSNGKLCLNDGEKKAQYEGFEGQYYLNANNENQPLVIDRGREHLAAADGRIYPGCYVNAKVDIWAQDNNFGKRVNATLLGVQFFADGERFGGGGARATEEDFEEYDPVKAAEIDPFDNAPQEDLDPFPDE